MCGQYASCSGGARPILNVDIYSSSALTEYEIGILAIEMVAALLSSSLPCSSARSIVVLFQSESKSSRTLNKASVAAISFYFIIPLTSFFGVLFLGCKL
jgi:hypothetical protein